MNKIVKRILIGLGIFIFLTIAAVAAVFIIIDPNDYRDELSQMAYKATGRKIEFRGDISLKIIPSLVFSIKDVNVAQPDGFGSAPMALVDELELKMALFPLLKKEVQVSAIALNGLTLNIIKDARGRYNFEGEPGDKAPKPDTAETSPGGDASEAEERMHTLLQSRIDSVNINNCILNYDDRPAKETMQLRLNKLKLGNVGLNRDITCVLDVAADLGKDMRGAFTMDGQARYELSEKLLKLDIKSFSVNAEAPELLSGRQEIRGSLSGLVNGASGAADLKAVLESAFFNGNADISLGGESGKGSVDLKAKPVVLVKALSPSMQKKLALPQELLVDNGPLRSLDVRLAFNMAGKTITVSTAELRLGGSDLVFGVSSLEAVMADTGGLASAEGGISLKGTLRPYLPLAGIKPKGGAFSKLDTSLAFKLAGDNLSVSNFKFLLDDKLAEASSKQISVRLAPAGPLLPIHFAKGDISLAAKPRELMNALDISLETADPKVLTAFNSSFNLNVDNTSLKISNLKGSLDETNLGGFVELLLSGAAGMPKGATSFAKVNLQVGAINLDRYLAPESAAAKPEKSGQTEQGASSGTSKKLGPPLKGTGLEKARAEITVGIKNLTIMKAPAQDITLDCVLSNGVFTVSKAALKTFGGQFNLSARADLVNANGPGALKAGLSGLDIGNALVTVMDEKRLGGQTSANFDFTFKGLDSDSILRTLNGNGNIMIKNGVLRDFQLIPEGSPPLLLKHRLSNYSFSDLGGSFNVVNGKLTNDDLGYKDKNMSLSGKGSVALVDRTIDYSGIVKTKETGEIPLRIRGPLSSPTVTLDQEALARMAADKAKEALVKDLQKKGALPKGDTPDERRKEAQQQINEKVGKELQRGLEKFIKK